MSKIKNNQGELMYEDDELTLFKLVEKNKKNLQNADLSYAKLSYANLSGADLSYADLSYVNLRNANLSGANLGGANLKWANLGYAVLTDTQINYQLEPGLIQKVAQHALATEYSLEMEDWHSCDSTHCIAGWACHLAKNGKELETMYGAGVAGLLLLGAEAHSHFYDDNEKAREYLNYKKQTIFDKIGIKGL